MKNKIKNAFVSVFLGLIFTLNACTPKASLADPVILAATTAPSTVASPVPATPVTQSALSATLSEITGKVEIKQAGQDSFTAAAAGSFLNENGQVQTGDDGRVRLDLSTGTIIRVAPASLFTLISNKPEEGSLKTSLELLLGKIFIILNGGSMEVQTPSGTAAVRGSYMSVEYNPANGGIRITCLEGNCSLATATGTVEITAGQAAVVTGPGAPPQVGLMSQQDIKEWLDNNPEASLVVEALTGATEAPTEIPPAVVYAPPDNYVPPPETKEPREPRNPSPTPITPIPSPVMPTVTITSVSPAASVVGQPLTITISVTYPGGPTPTGTVDVLADQEINICTASLKAGIANCVGGIPFAGNATTLVATYSGDGNYLSAQSAAWTGYAVNTASTTTTIASQAPNPSLPGIATTFTATVDVVPPGAGMPFGSVTFSDGVDSCVINQAPWTCSINFTSFGHKSVVATYTSSDANFGDSISSPVNQEVMDIRNIIGPISITLVNNTQCTQAYSVDIFDADGVANVQMEYSINDDKFTSPVPVSLSMVSANTWGTLTPFAIPYNAPDPIFWRFRITDAATPSNVTYFGSATLYTVGYTGSAVNAYSFNLAASVTCP